MKQLRLILAEQHEPPVTRSQLERRFFELCLKSHLPKPAMNTTVVGLEVDALWRQQGLVVELDGYQFHRSRAAFERDRLRDTRLQLEGYRVLRVTARQMAREPDQVAGAVRRLIRISR